MHEGTIERPDGRVLAWRRRGVEGGRPLLQLHGTPGSRAASSPHADLYERLGASVVTFDRPGYGASSPWRDRTVLDLADDALAVADAQGWDVFSVLGVSGGGPHALALGVRAPERLHRLGVAVGAAPIELVDPGDLIELNREARRRALHEGRESLEAFLAEPARQLLANPGDAIAAVMHDAPPADRELLESGAVRDMLEASLREAFANGPQGWFDDSWTLTQPWGFDLREVVSPVYLWYGELDRNVPIGSLRAMAAQLDVASLEILPGAGHLGWLQQEERVLEALLT